MRHHPREGKSDGEDDAEANIELPERRHPAAEKKADHQRQAAGDGDPFGAVAIEQVADERRQQGVHGEHDGKNPRCCAAAPAEGVEQGDVENTEGRMHSAGDSEHDKCDAGDEPGCG